MGFIKELFQKILGTDYESRNHRLRTRINELNSTSRKETEKANKIQSKKVANWFKLSEPYNIFDTISSLFTPRKFGEVVSMRQLQEKREKEERERINRLKNTVEHCFVSIRDLLNDEEVERAEDIFRETYSALKELKDDDLNLRYEEIRNKIAEVREAIIQKEILRRQEEERRRREEDERRRLEELKRKEQEELERLRKEKEAREYEEKLRKQEEERVLEETRLRNLVTQKKEDWETFINYLQMNHIHYFYHFTDKRNLQSIKKLKGLYSWQYCEEHDITIPNAGGDSWSRSLDSKYGLQDYVRLSFCNDHPMAYRKHCDGAELVLLKISIDVAAFKDTLFSDKNAADSSHSHGCSLEHLKRVNIRATQMSFVRKEDPCFAAHQAECMVKTFIPIEFIVNIDNPQAMYF